MNTKEEIINEYLVGGSALGHLGKSTALAAPQSTAGYWNTKDLSV